MRSALAEHLERQEGLCEGVISIVMSESGTVKGFSRASQELFGRIWNRVVDLSVHPFRGQRGCRRLTRGRFWSRRLLCFSTASGRLLSRPESDGFTDGQNARQMFPRKGFPTSPQQKALTFSTSRINIRLPLVFPNSWR